MVEESKQSERADRIAKLEKIKEAGINPYPAKTERDHDIKQVLADHAFFAKRGKAVTIAGRLRRFQQHGNISFASLEDYTGKIQIAFSKKEIGDDAYKQIIKLIDVGDFIQVNGTAFTTKIGENSIMAKSWKLLTKALRPLPDKHAGFKDEEERLRKRYLDIIMNPEVKDMILRRDIFWNATRSFLKDRGFIEVETPVLEITTGGADARPFLTHHNALDLDVYLRISTGELWQKKLMVAGLGKTFEIGRQFRNEGMDAEHLQDYTQMEFYYGYANYEMGMEMVEEMYKYIAKETFGTLKFKIGNHDINLGQKWEKYDYVNTIKKHTNINVLTATEREIEKKLQELKIDYDKKGFNITRAIDNLWKYCRKQISGPGFLVGVPVAVSPLAKRMEKNTDLAQRFQVILAGSEMGNGYSELNDPIDQAKRFKEQQQLREAGDDEAMMADEGFVEALEYGMPPTCGFGFSERLFSFLMNKSSRECQIFPLMKPKNK
ncbi:MAG: lysine--tRNA ligase [bacterium]